jgi:hypothetical protein
VVAKVRERLATSKQAAQDFDVENFNLRKPSELQLSKQCSLVNSTTQRSQTVLQL